MRRSRSAEILVVEDNADDLELTLRGLERSRYPHQVSITRDGAEALEYVQRVGRYSHLQGQPPPRVILLDIKLPLVDGIEVLRQIRTDLRLRHIPVVMMTSSAEDRDLRACYSLGANSYVVKPVDVGRFFQTIQSVSEYWISINEPAVEPPLVRSL